METEGNKESLPKRILHLYVDGFKSMTIGRTLWAVILIKLFIIFAILKLFFFPDFLETQFPDNEQRAEHVRSSLIHNHDATASDNN